YNYPCPYSKVLLFTEFPCFCTCLCKSYAKIDRTRLSSKEWRDWGSRGVWHIPSVRTNDDHEAKFPLELPRRFIQLFTEPGEIVLDCFMGSGTTAVAALQQQRQFIGIDLVEEYVKLAQTNIQKAMMARYQLELPIGDD
ncbi:MAG: site-specific DNA-methyltransferase, partial [Anaerolineae bacterium]|nr:site-specific DNA-methyltransferase [Anaerolineae bacterium]